jgi:hypothetical protein
MLVSVERGCGARQPGGAYLVSALGPGGIPLERCVLDPPTALPDPTAVGLAPQGMTLAQGSGGRTLVLDWEGQESYPNVADYVEEVALFGSSRRVPVSFDFAQLGPGARHVLVHPRAVVENRGWLLAHLEYAAQDRGSFLARARSRFEPPRPWCPFRPDAPGHVAGKSDTDTDPMCATLWWECLLPGTVRFDDDQERFEAQCERTLSVVRRMPAFDYEGYTLPDRDLWVPRFGLGAFLALPITRIEVVTDPEDKTHEPALDKARKARLPVVEVDA